MNENQPIQENVSVTTHCVSPAPLTSPVQSKSKSKRILVLTVIHTIAALILTYFVFQYTLLKKQVSQPQPTPVVSPTPSSTSSPTSSFTIGEPSLVFNSSSEWRTYIEKDFGFSFDYPSDKYVIKFQCGMDSTCWSISDKPLDLSDPQNVAYADGQEQVFIFPENNQEYYTNYLLKSGQDKLLDDIQLDGKSVKVLSFEWPGKIEGRAYLIQMKQDLLVIHIVSKSGYFPFSKKFVDSFKFTQ